MNIKHEIKKLFHKVGYDISRFPLPPPPSPAHLVRKRLIFYSYKIDTVLDIGANSGQFAQYLRGDICYTNRILSFEPLSTAFELLKEKTKNDSAWEAFNFAIGDTEEKKEINIAGNSLSSSILNMLPSHLSSAPDSKYIGKEVIEIKTVDSLFGDLCETAKNIYLKIDAQGYESKVLKGAENSLAHIDTVQMEMSIIPLYEFLFRRNRPRVPDEIGHRFRWKQGQLIGAKRRWFW